MSDKETLAAYAAKAEDYANLVSRITPDQDLQAFSGCHAFRRAGTRSWLRPRKLRANDGRGGSRG